MTRQSDFASGVPRAARMALCGEPGVGIGRVLLVEFASPRQCDTPEQSVSARAATVASGIGPKRA